MQTLFPWACLGEKDEKGGEGKETEEGGREREFKVMARGWTRGCTLEGATGRSRLPRNARHRTQLDLPLLLQATQGNSFFEQWLVTSAQIILCGFNFLFLYRAMPTHYRDKLHTYVG